MEESLRRITLGGAALLQIITQIGSYSLTVAHLSKDPYKFKPISQYSLGQRVVIRLAGWMFYAIIVALGKTLRFDAAGIDCFASDTRGKQQPIVCIWHDRLMTSAYYMRGRRLVLMSSISFDAEYTARCIQRLGFGVVKGSSTRGGSRALVEMIRLMKQGAPIGFTVDGPKGPRYVAKAGPALLAKRTGNPMITLNIEVDHFWTLNSWDRLQIPRPFSRARAFFGEPIFVPADANDDLLEEKQRELQHALDDLVERGKAWGQHRD